jgi:2-hydroxy-6-oxonona-2,4-dienedioate hydrolase
MLNRWVVAGAGAVAAMGGARAARRYRESMREIRRVLDEESKVAQTAAGPVEYAEAGDGPAVLVAHGIGGGYDQGMLALRVGGNLPFRLVAVSRFGYLRTPMPRNGGVGPEAQAGAYAALLDTLGIERAAMIGISAGGPSALQFALRHPERCSALVLVSAVTGRLVPSLTVGQRALLQLVNTDPGLWALSTAAEERLFAAYGVTPEKRRELEAEPEKMAVVRAIFVSLPMSKRRVGFNNDMSIFPGLPVYPLERITAPTLVLHGTADNVVPPEHARFAASTIPGARLHMVEGGGHLCVVTHKEEAVPVIEGFLAEHLGAATGAGIR